MIRKIFGCEPRSLLLQMAIAGGGMALTGMVFGEPIITMAIMGACGSLIANAGMAHFKEKGWL